MEENDIFKKIANDDTKNPTQLMQEIDKELSKVKFTAFGKVTVKKSRNIYHYQANKCKKDEHFIKRDKLLNACVNGSSDIFSEIKK